MKKLICTAIAFIILTTSVLGGQTIGLNINNKAIESDVPAQIIDGRTLVPLRTLFENIGAKVDWDAATKKITGTKGSVKLEMYVNSTNCRINGDIKPMDVSPVIIDGRTMVPARYVAEAFDLTVDWDSNTKTVIIKSKPAATTVSTTQTTTKAETTTKTVEKSTETTTKPLETTTAKSTETTKASDKATDTTKAVVENASAVTTSKAAETKAENTTNTESTTETTTMYSPDLCCDIPDVKISIHKVVLNDIKSAAKGYNIGNANSLNRLKDTTRKALISQWDSAAISPSEKEFVKQSKIIYQNIALCYKKIDTRYQKYPGNESVAYQCKQNKEKIDNFLIKYYQAATLKDVTDIADNLQKLYKSLPS